MANNLKTLNVNSVDFSFKDTEARKNIEALNDEKAEAFSVNYPLKYENNVLSINLSNYTTVDSFNEIIDELNNTINDDNNNLSKKISTIQTILKKVFNDGIIIDDSDDITINSNSIPSLNDYESKIENITSSINTINTNINNINSTLQEDINNKYNEIIEKINTFNDDKTENITNLQNRVSRIENNLFSSSETTNYTRIDDMETKINDMYNRLLSIGILQEE